MRGSTPSGEHRPTLPEIQKKVKRIYRTRTDWTGTFATVQPDLRTREWADITNLNLKTLELQRKTIRIQIATIVIWIIAIVIALSTR